LKIDAFETNIVNQSGEKHDECLFSGCCGNALKQKLAAGRME
jgi:hypothetical protein